MALIYTYPPIGSIEDADLLLVSDVSLASNATRNMDLGTFASYVITSRNIITGKGTTDTIPVFTSPTTIGDSVMTKVSGGLQIAGGLTITDFLIADGSVRLLGPTAFSANILNVNGTTNLNGNANVSGAAFIEGNLTVEGEGVFDQDVTIEGDSDLNGSLNVQGTSVLTGAVTTNAITVNGASTFNAYALFEDISEFQATVKDSQGNPGTAGQVLTSTVDGVQWSSVTASDVTGSGTNLTIPMWFGASPTSNLADSTLTLSLVDAGNLNPYSLQFGGNSTATGLRNSVAIGYNVQATNESTLATGFGTAAIGINAASFNFETIASGNKSAAFGSGSTASGVASFAIGLGNTAATSNSFAGGLNSTANPSLNGTSAFAFGNALNVTGEDAAGFGRSNTVAGKRNFAAGRGNQVAGDNSLAIGTNNVVSAGGCAAIGSNNEATAFGSFAIGQGNKMNNNQTAAFGYNLTSGSKQYQVVVGKYNEVNNDAFFVVGTGAGSGTLKNGLEVYGDKVILPEYGSGTVTAVTPAFNIQVDAAGRLIETAAVDGPVTNVTDTYTSTPKVDYIVTLTQDQYDNDLGTPDPNTLYIII